MILCVRCSEQQLPVLELLCTVLFNKDMLLPMGRPQGFSFFSFGDAGAKREPAYT